MGFASFAQGRIVGGGPDTLAPAVVRQKMHGMPKMLVTASAKPDFVDLPGLVADRCGAGHALTEPLPPIDE